MTIGQPLGLGLVAERAGVLGGELLPDRDQIVAGIEAARDLDDLAERLAVAEERRLGERLDLAAGVVDVVLARHVVAGVGHQRGERIAEHGAAGMADVHRAGGVGGDVLDVDLLALADVGAAEIGALLERGAEDGVPGGVGEAEVEEAGTGDLGRDDLGVVLEGVGELGRDLARILAERLCDDHRGVGREIAMRGIARRLDDDLARGDRRARSG